MRAGTFLLALFVPVGLGLHDTPTIVNELFGLAMTGD